jgi:hypothetical protein
MTSGYYGDRAKAIPIKNPETRTRAEARAETDTRRTTLTVLVAKTDNSSGSLLIGMMLIMMLP